MDIKCLVLLDVIVAPIVTAVIVIVMMIIIEAVTPAVVVLAAIIAAIAAQAVIAAQAAIVTALPAVTLAAIVSPLAQSAAPRLLLHPLITSVVTCLSILALLTAQLPLPRLFLSYLLKLQSYPLKLSLLPLHALHAPTMLQLPLCQA